MKVLILLVVCLSVIGCGRKGERIHNIQDLQQDQLNIVNNKFDIDILALNLNTRRNRNIQPICRGIEGCLKVCEYFDKAKCKQLSVDKVLAFWMNQISMYSKWEHARNDLNLIATQPEVSDFLSNVDKNNQVMEALFNLRPAANCPMNDHNILYSASPYVTLYLGAPEVMASTESSEGEEAAEEAVAIQQAVLQKAVEEAEVGVEVAQEALAAEAVDAKLVAAKEALAADAADAADAKLVAAKEALAADAADAKVAEAQAAVEVAGAEPVVEHADDGELAEADIPGKQIPVSTKKKIMDGQVLYFNLHVFVGYMKKCFGFDTKTFSEIALEIENKKAFEMGDKVISKACSENSECIRLAYCAIDSELVWENVKPSIKDAGCDYENFSEMLP